jgi:hypothetical protein
VHFQSPPWHHTGPWPTRGDHVPGSQRTTVHLDPNSGPGANPDGEPEAASENAATRRFRRIQVAVALVLAGAVAAVRYQGEHDAVIATYEFLYGGWVPPGVADGELYDAARRAGTLFVLASVAGVLGAVAGSAVAGQAAARTAESGRRRWWAGTLTGACAGVALASTGGIVMLFAAVGAVAVAGILRRARSGRAA